MRRFARSFSFPFALALALVGCDGTQASPYDAGADFAIAPQVTHLGVNATTCCLVANRGNQAVLYLARPKPSMTVRGREQPARGELHLADPYGVDFLLASDVPAGGYDFAPNGLYAIFTQLVQGSTDSYSLNFATLTSPELKQPNVSTAIASGLSSRPLSDQAFTTPTGRFLIVGSRSDKMERSPDLHVVDLKSGKDIFSLTDGAFSYIETFSSTDVMFYQNAVGSRTPGEPTVQGLYAVALDAAITSAVTPALVDERTAEFTLHADDHSLIYVRATGELMLYDMRDQTKLKLADNVITFSLGPSRRGPLAFISNDRALHIRPILNEETVTTPPGSVDVTSVLRFSPDGQHVYFFRNYQSQDRSGDLWHIGLPPSGSGTPSLVAPRVSSRTLMFEGATLLLAQNTSLTGELGDLVAVALDGSNPRPLARAVDLLAIETAHPAPAAPPETGITYGPLDMAPPFIPAVIAHLSSATIDAAHDLASRPIDDTRPILGALAIARTALGPILPIADAVPTGRARFSDDGYILHYVADAKWDTTASNYLGVLRACSATTGESIPLPAALSSVSQIGPVVERSFYVNAPGAPGQAGIYFVKY